jgi:hypothetical protein
MTRTVVPRGKAAKSGRFPKRKQNCTTGNQNSAVRAAIHAAGLAIKHVLPRDKSAWELHILTGAGLSTCQKVLSGHRELNLETVVALLQSEHGLDVLRALLGDVPPTWFEDLENLDDIAKLKSDQLRMAREVEKREQRLLEARARR